MTEYELTDEEKKALESLKQFSRKIDSVPENKKIPISNPEKYDFPLGINDGADLNTSNDADKTNPR